VVPHQRRRRLLHGESLFSSSYGQLY
jgi:hypothetical protein